MAVSESATSKQPSPIKPHVNETSSEGTYINNYYISVSMVVLNNGNQHETS